MADNKYGRLFTTSDVEKMLEFLQRHDDDTMHVTLQDILVPMDEAGTRFKFDPDEPVFVLRGRDRRAEAAVRFYGMHQAPSAPINHLEGIQRAVTAFNSFATLHPELMKDPD
jgi:hypothetical protein